MSSFKDSGAEVDIEDVEQAVFTQRQICSQHAALFAFVRDVGILPRGHWKAAEGQVAIGAAVQIAIRSKAWSVIRKCALDPCCLVESSGMAGSIDHFLQADQVCLHLAQNRDDAFGHRSAIEPAALVDVVSDYPKANEMCTWVHSSWRSTIQPSSCYATCQGRMCPFVQRGRPLSTRSSELSIECLPMTIQPVENVMLTRG